MISKPELLCPAGSPAAFDAAIDAGADAIYLGLPSFNARINANNFTPADIGAAFSRAHAYGVKVYVTLNTLVFDRERDDFLRTAESAYLAGADGFIVADLGAARLLRSYMSDIELHASTQMSGHNVAAAEELQKLGFTRMVCAREMSESDLRSFVKNSPIEAEVFVHGALCVCHSGQCLFSSLVGGRSGNRGECAQPCRLPYAKGKGNNAYPLSLKDLSWAAHVDTLCDMGIASFKIEGRMKSPEYVRDVTRIWRRLIDERRGADAKEMALLSEIFSRGGLTDGYFKGNVGSSMLGVRSDKDKQKSRELCGFEGLTRKIPIDIKVTLKAGEASSMTVMPHGVTVCGDVPQAARTAPIDEECVRRNVSKLGGTPYEARTIEIELDGGLMMPISAINRLRRQAVEALMENGRSKEKLVKKNAEFDVAEGKAIKKISAVFYDVKSIPESAKDFFDVIYTPLHLYGGQSNGVLMPAVIFDSERQEVEDMLCRAYKLGARHVLVGNVGHFDIVRHALGEGKMILHADYRMNIANGASAKAVEELLALDMIVSPELSLPQIRDIGGDRLCVVYGKLPLMTLEKCVMREISDCKSCENGKWAYLVDRRGARFAVCREWKHRNIIFNSVPVYMADRRETLVRNKIVGEHFIFTDETAREAAAIISAYKKGAAPVAPIRRISN